MPYYRITIELRDKKPAQGIRHYDNQNIDAVTNIARVKATRHYGDNNVLDVEAAMLSNHCTAVKQYQAKQQKRKENKKFNDGIESDLGTTKSRKSIYKGDIPTLGDRNKI
ncbi:MAG: hypothetical protein H0U27_02335 [Nitrosopumilus sp.]|nr:hypothetical protein [Nitrosopumilus sp.]